MLSNGGITSTPPELPENAVFAVRRRPVGHAAMAMSPDEIEQRIIGAYVRLACAPDRHGCNSAIVAPTGALELRLTEVPEKERRPGVPWFWLELYSRTQHAVVDRCGCNGFDDWELTKLVEFALAAGQPSRP